MAKNKKKENEQLAVDDIVQEEIIENENDIQTQSSLQDNVIKIGEKAESKKLNKFDNICLKIWTYIVAFVTAISVFINNCIFKIFKKRLPQRYITAVISIILIILAMLIVTAPFKITVNEKQTLEIYNSGLTPIYQKVGETEDNVPVYKWGYANEKGKIVIPCQYNNASEFKHGVAFVNVVNDVDGIVEDYWCLIDKNGKLKGDKKFYYSTALGDRLPVGEFGDADKLAWVYIGGKFGYIGNNGKMQIDALYNDAGDFINGLARVRSGSQEFFINKKGEQVSDSFDKVRDFSEGFAAVRKNELWGFVDTSGNIVFETRFDNVSDFYCGYALVKSGSSYGVIDTNGKLVVPLSEYNDIGVAKYFDTSWWD